MLITVILGSNSGQKARILNEARQRLIERCGAEVNASHIYETEPWGFQSNEPFLNQVIVYQTALSPHEFLRQSLLIEQQLGRVRPSNVRYAARTIDIDLLFCDSQVIQTSDLTIPHPRIADRRFVLTPLAEIMPEFIHPVFLRTISEMLHDCPDSLNVKMM